MAHEEQFVPFQKPNVGSEEHLLHCAPAQFPVHKQLPFVSHRPWMHVLGLHKLDCVFLRHVGKPVYPLAHSVQLIPAKNPRVADAVHAHPVTEHEQRGKVHFSVHLSPMYGGRHTEHEGPVQKPFAATS